MCVGGEGGGGYYHAYLPFGQGSHRIEAHTGAILAFDGVGVPTCRSDERALCRESAESVYAAMVLSSIMICCCMREESSVQRPWRIKSTTARTEGVRLLEKKGGGDTVCVWACQGGAQCVCGRIRGAQCVWGHVRGA